MQAYSICGFCGGERGIASLRSAVCVRYRSLRLEPALLLRGFEPLSYLVNKKMAEREGLFGASCASPLRGHQHKTLMFKFAPGKFVEPRVLIKSSHTAQIKKAPKRGFFNLAEREGFEPSIRLTVYTLSRRAPSTTRTPLQYSYCLSSIDASYSSDASEHAACSLLGASSASPFRPAQVTSCLKSLPAI